MELLKQVFRKGGWALTLVLVLASFSPVQAAGFGFYNECKIPIIVQGASMVNNMLRRGQPILIQPSKTGWDNNLSPGLRYITIFDANQPSRVLFRERVVFRGQDVLYKVCPLKGSKNKVTIEPQH